MDGMETPLLYTPTEFAAEIGVSRGRLSQLVAEGAIKPTLRKGKRTILFGAEAIQAYADVH